jgi:putative oxidoreductase
MTTTPAPTITASTAATVSAPATKHLLAVTGRVLIAAIFILSGLNKIANPDATIAYIASAGLPFAPAALIAAALIEVGGGLALIAGFRTRTVALALAGFSVVAAIAFHAHFADQNQLIHFLKNIAIAGGLLQVAAFGPGRISLDKR